jgi:hypothetical protein
MSHLARGPSMGIDSKASAIGRRYHATSHHGDGAEALA